MQTSRSLDSSESSAVRSAWRSINRGRGRLTAESAAMRERPQIGFLHEVIDILAPDESCCHTAQLAVGVDVGLGERVCHVVS